MDELPNDAREFLRLAADAHDPPSAEARARVRRGVAMAVGVGMGVTVAGQAVAHGTAKAGVLSSLAGKLAAAGIAVAVATTAVVTVPKLMPQERGESAHRKAAGAPKAAAVPVQAPRVEEAKIQEGKIAGQAPAEQVLARSAEPPAAAELSEAHAAPEASHRRSLQPKSAHRGPKATRQSAAHSARAQSPIATLSPVTKPVVVAAEESKVSKPVPVQSTDTLRAEMGLLSQASQALSAGDLARAERALEQHRQTFAASVLREERDGLMAILRCSQDPARAKAAAERFIARAPKSVLAERVARACKLGGEP